MSKYYVSYKITLQRHMKVVRQRYNYEEIIKDYWEDTQTISCSKEIEIDKKLTKEIIENEILEKIRDFTYEDIKEYESDSYSSPTIMGIIKLEE